MIFLCVFPYPFHLVVPVKKLRERDPPFLEEACVSFSRLSLAAHLDNMKVAWPVTSLCFFFVFFSVFSFLCFPEKVRGGSSFFGGMLL